MNFNIVTNRPINFDIVVVSPLHYLFFFKIIWCKIGKIGAVGAWVGGGGGKWLRGSHSNSIKVYVLN